MSRKRKKSKKLYTISIVMLAIVIGGTYYYKINNDRIIEENLQKNIALEQEQKNIETEIIKKEEIVEEPIIQEPIIEEPVIEEIVSDPFDASISPICNAINIDYKISNIKTIYDRDYEDEKGILDFVKLNEAFEETEFIHDNTGEKLDELNTLKETAPEISNELDFIIQHQDRYPYLAIKDVAFWQESINYTIDYPVKKGTAPKEQDPIIYKQGEIPLLLQWDDRWGYLAYGGESMGYSACGPTALSMIVIGLTGDTTVTPYEIGKYSMENGHYIKGQGTAWTLMSVACKNYGVKSKVISMKESSLKAQLDKGHPLIASVHKGRFTENGHFITIVGYNEEGFIINDPFSLIRSLKVWPYELLETELRNVWAFSVI